MNDRTLIPHEVMVGLITTALRAPIGPIVEVGVYRGGSAIELAAVARHRGVKLHLFDTFAGMPFANESDKHRPGEFADTSLTEIKALIPTAICYPGVFPETLPSDLAGIAFVHCDVDQYQSTADVIEKLWSRLLLGGIIWFDDPELPEARRAIEERFDPDELHSGPMGRLYVVKDYDL